MLKKNLFLCLICLLPVSVCAQGEYFDFGQTGGEVGVFYGTSDGIKNYGIGVGISYKGVVDLNGTYGRVNFESFGFDPYFGTISRGYDLYSVGMGLHPFNNPRNKVRLALTGSIGSINREGSPTVYTILPYVHTNLNSGPNGYFKFRLGVGFSDVFDDINEEAEGFMVVGGSIVVNKQKRNSIIFDVNYTKTNNSYTIGFGLGLLFRDK